MKVYVWGGYHNVNGRHVRGYDGVTMSLQEAINNYWIIELGGNDAWVHEHDVLTGKTRDLKLFNNPEFYDVIDRAKIETRYMNVNDKRPDRV